MSTEDLFDEERPPLYTRPYQLPPNIAFEIMSYSNVEKRNSKEKTHKIVIKTDEFTSLMVYPGARFPKMNDTTIPTFNTKLAEGEKYYLVARRWTSIDRVPLDIVGEQKRLAQNLPLYDCDIHTIKPVDSAGNLYSADEVSAGSPSKRFKSAT
ncbi:Alpha-1,4-glucan:maltose-1-phosphate maltosyltransferase [Frankliniella fusca]|uniref:Alpha-1,4-glucan:maltose-1-phosphate maltosyltransferase n=1 Tax=Frankliniella fusca TaxID=407009 RepID=A0AAE1I2W7_9NEOP|nr:Alpha-1,4-glucan:maltose-1-phosphate maltosyltransferase [Frankliniella fusca]